MGLDTQALLTKMTYDEEGLTNAIKGGIFIAFLYQRADREGRVDMETKQKNPMGRKLGKIFSYLKRVVSWILDGGFYILSIITVIVTILYIVRVINFYPNIVASVLAILGLLIILTLQIFDAIDFAEHKPNTFINWIKSFPTLRPAVIMASTPGHK